MIETYQAAVEAARAAVPDLLAAIGLPIAPEGFEDAEAFVIGFEEPAEEFDPDLVVNDGGGPVVLVDKATGRVWSCQMYEIADRVHDMDPTT